MELWRLTTSNLTIPVEVVVILLLLHLIGDFLLQSDWMALNKSKDWTALWCHVTAYTVCFVPFFGLMFGVITWATHFLTDALTSRLTSALWFINLRPYEVVLVENGKMDTYHWLATLTMEKRHWFFVAIGVDQVIHYLTLLLTYRVLEILFS